MDIIENLMRFGLTRQESTLYVQLLAEGAMTGYEAAKATGISRSNAYTSLAGLVDKGAACTVDGTPLALTKKEFEILALLLSNRGRIFSREEILHQVWSDEVIVLDRTIDVNITRLRRKIGVYGDHIVTRLGYGYGFEE